MTQAETAPGRRFFYWLGRAARQARDEAGVSREQIAVEINRGREVIDRFERGSTQPRDLEMLLAAYAYCCDLADPRELIVEAMRQWYADGFPPTLNAPVPTTREKP